MQESGGGVKEPADVWFLMDLPGPCLAQPLNVSMSLETRLLLSCIPRAEHGASDHVPVHLLWMGALLHELDSRQRHYTPWLATIS